MQGGENYIVLLIIASTSIIAIVLILVFVFFQAYQKRSVRQKLELQEVQNNHQLQLLRATLEVQERERKRIASDLHDDIGSLLSALKLNVKHLEGLPKLDEERPFLIQTRKMLEEGLENVRNISYDLLPPTLERMGLWEAIRETSKRINDSGEIEIEYIAPKKEERLDKRVELAMFRILQEMIANTLHHANANQITIHCKITSQHIMVNYADDGTNVFDKEALNGLGISNMLSRASAIDGEIEFKTNGNDGFMANIIVHLNN